MVMPTLVAMIGLLGLTSCVPDPAPAAATRLDVTTLLTWCGGVIPPPGESWCHTNPTSTAVEILQGRAVVATGTSGTDGHLVVDVAAGTYVVAAAAPPSYMECDTPTVVAVAGATTPVVQTCNVFAP